MANYQNNQRIIPLEEGWNDEIKAKVRQTQNGWNFDEASGLAGPGPQYLRL